MTVATVAPVSRETVADLSPGDAVELAIDTYEWTHPLDVVDANDPVEWDVRFGADWWMRTIYLKARNAKYGVLYDDRGDDEPHVICHRIEDGELGDMRGTVVHLEPVEHSADHDDDSAAESEGQDPAELRPDGLTEACVHSVAEFYDTLDEVADDFGVDRDRAQEILDAHGCAGEVGVDA